MNHLKDLTKNENSDCDEEENNVETSKLIIVGVDVSTEAKSLWRRTTNALNDLITKASGDRFIFF